MTEIEKYFEDFFSGDLSADKQEELISHLESNQEEKETFIQLYLDHQTLAVAGSENEFIERLNNRLEWSQDEDLFIEQVKSANQSIKYPYKLLVSIAAAAVIILTFILFYQKYELPKILNAENNEKAEYNKIVRFKKQGKLVYKDGSILYISPGTELMIKRSSGKKIKLIKGTVIGEIKPQNISMKIETDVQTEVLGTLFQLTKNKKGTTLYVSKGSVKFNHLKVDAGKSISNFGEKANQLKYELPIQNGIILRLIADSDNFKQDDKGQFISWNDFKNSITLKGNFSFDAQKKGVIFSGKNKLHTKKKLNIQSIFIVSQVHRECPMRGGIFGEYKKDFGIRFAETERWHGNRDYKGKLIPGTKPVDVKDFSYEKGSSFFVNGTKTDETEFNNKHLLSSIRNSAYPFKGITIGGYFPDGTRNFKGKVHEIVAFNRKLSYHERVFVEDYLLKKWNIKKN